MMHNRHCNISPENIHLKIFYRLEKEMPLFNCEVINSLQTGARKSEKTVINAIGGTVIRIVLPSWQFIDASKPSTTTPGRKESTGLV